MNKKRTIDSFYKPIKDVVREPETVTQTQTENQTNGDNIMEESPRARVEPETNTTLNTDEVKLESLIRDPGVRPPLSSYPSNQQDEIRRTYIRLGPYQLVKAHYPLSPCGFHKRRFQAAWFRRFWWLEYSDKKDAAFCFSCYLFGRKPIGRVGSDTFTAKGFNNWRKVNSGTTCLFVNHEGKTPASAHNFSTCPLRGGDELPTSLNRGNYLELVKLLALYNKDVARVLENAPKNAKYTSLDIQKELLQMFAMKVQEAIRDEIGTAKFYTNALTLKNETLSSLSHLKLDVQDIRGQGYDGASNICGEWNGLKALILNECPFAYYVYCFAHQLQLALVAASKDDSEVHTFFKHLNFIVNVIGSSTKRNDQLQDAQLAEISYLAKIGELEGGSGANQMQNIQRPEDTRWSLHFKSICSLVRLFGPTRVVLNDICIGRSTCP
ncbi:zinc finger MYM-type protein 1-like protein [Tanacetum coccineum]|uniref:Zinc finger MYM-type protein 1-like protein n=1 Tax=Tanacetum coccineum TaxID=301880 RepID=A0ABQ4WJH3_9ASTR